MIAVGRRLASWRDAGFSGGAGYREEGRRLLGSAEDSGRSGLTERMA